MTEQTKTPSSRQRSLDEVIVPAHLHHVNLKVVKLDEMRAFYTSLLGIHPTVEVGPIGFYTYDAANHRLALLHDPAFTERVPGSAGMHHMAFEYNSIDDLMHTYQRLKRSDILPRFALDHGLTTSYYYQDPDGNYVEMQVDNFGDWARSSEWTRTAPEFVADPIGKVINPESYLAAWQAGASLAELHRRAYAGEFSEGMPMISID
jgi:catechol-2,3-dioxygenase